MITFFRGPALVIFCSCSVWSSPLFDFSCYPYANDSQRHILTYLWLLPFQLPHHQVGYQIPCLPLSSQVFSSGKLCSDGPEFFVGSSALPELSAHTSGFWLDCAPSAWLGAPWGLGCILFLFFLHSRTCTVPGYSKCSINVCGNYSVISAVIEMCTKSSRNTWKSKFIFHIEQSWVQGEHGERLGRNLQGEGGKRNCPLLRVLTKQARKECLLCLLLLSLGHLWPVASPALGLDDFYGRVCK